MGFAEQRAKTVFLEDAQEDNIVCKNTVTKIFIIVTALTEYFLTTLRPYSFSQANKTELMSLTKYYKSMFMKTIPMLCIRKCLVLSMLRIGLLGEWEV